MESIYIVGFMGTGKTEVSQLLGEKMNMEVMDTDHIIETKLERTISQIFEEYGENYFRQLEHIVLKGVVKENRIITTGGGMVIQVPNREYLKKKKNVICLKASVATILERLKDDNTRPLLQQENKLEAIEQLLEERKDMYESVSTIIVDTDGLTVEEVVEEILSKIKQEV